MAGFFQPVIALFDHMVTEGFVSTSQRALAFAESEPVALLDRMAHYRAPTAPETPRLRPEQT